MMTDEITNALTVDVEDYFQVSAFAGNIDPQDWDNHELRVEANTTRILDLFEKSGYRATFFVLGWVAERQPGLVKAIHDRGHEIACHGYSHQLIYNQTPGVFREETVKAKAILEDLIQAPVLGYRAASYSITQQSLWALDILAEAGFTYDSSIFPVRHDRYGIPGAKDKPHLLTTPAGHEIVEFPISTREYFGYRLPVGGGGYFRIYPYAFSRMALKSINDKLTQPFIFYLHPWEVDPGQPRINTNWLSRFRHYNNLHKCEARLTKLLTDFRFSRVTDVLSNLGFADDLTPKGLKTQYNPDARRVGGE
jgi:polysaccharide deacetylase family protein (PEP-CTERM system associated)